MSKTEQMMNDKIVAALAGLGVQTTIGPNGAPVPVASGPVTQKPAAQKPMTATEKQIADLKAQIAALRRTETPTLKVSPKGAVQINGMGRWPTVLYASQLEWIFANQKILKDFIAKYEREDYRGTARNESKQEYSYVARITRKAQ